MRKISPLLSLFFAVVASAHPGHGEDPVHYAIGLDWPFALGLLIGGVAMVAFARALPLRILGGVMTCAGVAFVASLV